MSLTRSRSRPAWDSSHHVLGYVDGKSGQGRPLKARYYFDKTIAGENMLGDHYETKSGERFSDLRRGAESYEAKAEREFDRSSSWEDKWHIYGALGSLDNHRLNPHCRHYFESTGYSAGFRNRGLQPPPAYTRSSSQTKIRDENLMLMNRSFFSDSKSTSSSRAGVARAALKDRMPLSVREERVQQLEDDQVTEEIFMPALSTQAMLALHDEKTGGDDKKLMGRRVSRGSVGSMSTTAFDDSATNSASPTEMSSASTPTDPSALSTPTGIINNNVAPSNNAPKLPVVPEASEKSYPPSPEKSRVVALPECPGSEKKKKVIVEAGPATVVVVAPPKDKQVAVRTSNNVGASSTSVRASSMVTRRQRKGEWNDSWWIPESRMNTHKSSYVRKYFSPSPASIFYPTAEDRARRLERSRSRSIEPATPTKGELFNRKMKVRSLRAASTNSETASLVSAFEAQSIMSPTKPAPNHDDWGTDGWYVYGKLSQDNPKLNSRCRHYFSNPGIQAGARARGLRVRDKRDPCETREIFADQKFEEVERHKSDGRWNDHFQLCASRMNKRMSSYVREYFDKPSRYLRYKLKEETGNEF